MRKSLELAIPSGLNRAGNIQLLNVKLASSDSPFAVVRYAVDGEEQELGLRLDLDKQVFLDKTGDPGFDDDLQNRAVDVVDVVSQSLESGQTQPGASRSKVQKRFVHAPRRRRVKAPEPQER